MVVDVVAAAVVVVVVAVVVVAGWLVVAVVCRCQYILSMSWSHKNTTCFFTSRFPNLFPSSEKNTKLVTFSLSHLNN